MADFEFLNKKALRTVPDQTSLEASLAAHAMEPDYPSGAPGTMRIEGGAGGTVVTVITLTDHVVPMVDEAGVVAYGGSQLLTFPEGLICYLGGSADLDITKSSAGVNDDWDGDIAVGTVTASNNATLATTEQNLLPTTATPQAVAGATTGDMVSTATEAATVFDGTTTAVAAFLNVLVDDADHDVTTTPCNLIFNGTITLVWSYLGDN